MDTIFQGHTPSLTAEQKRANLRKTLQIMAKAHPDNTFWSGWLAEIEAQDRVNEQDREGPDPTPDGGE